MVSGMCKLFRSVEFLVRRKLTLADIGEITRNILLHFIDSSLLFDGYSSKILNSHYGYDAAFVSAVEGAKSDEEVKKIIISQLTVDASKISPSCIEIVRWACEIVSIRAAQLAACAIAAVIIYTKNHEKPANEPDAGVDVGLDGS